MAVVKLGVWPQQNEGCGSSIWGCGDTDAQSLSSLIGLFYLLSASMQRKPRTNRAFFYPFPNHTINMQDFPPSPLRRGSLCMPHLTGMCHAISCMKVISLAICTAKLALANPQDPANCRVHEGERHAITGLLSLMEPIDSGYSPGKVSAPILCIRLPKPNSKSERRHSPAT